MHNILLLHRELLVLKKDVENTDVSKNCSRRKLIFFNSNSSL